MAKGSATNWNAILRWALYGAVTLLFAIACHKFFRFVDAAPYVAVDDALANVSSFLSGTGRYGMPVSPVESLTPGIRLGSMMIYGPQTFVFGAALDWLFGTSYVVARSIHLVSLGLIAVLAFLTFGKRRAAAGGFFSALLVFVFLNAQWPMFRPDIVTALLLAATIACASWAVATENRFAWLLTGFMAANAASNHQIAWAVVPSVVVIWAASLRWEREQTRSRRDYVFTLSSLAVGGLAGGLIHLIGIDFRIRDLLATWSAYAHFTAGLSAHGTPEFIGTLGHHMQIAWGNVPKGLVILMYLLCFFGACLLGRAFFSRRSSARAYLALLLPPIVIGSGYQLSLGLYTNFHVGYTLPTQITSVWAASAFLTAILSILETHRSTALSIASVMATAAACVLVLGESWHFARAETNWEWAAARQAPFYEYSANVLSEIPQDAKVFGDEEFGIQAGTRYDLVAIKEGLDLTSKIRTSSLSRFVPDYLVLNRYIDSLAFLIAQAKRERSYTKGLRPNNFPKGTLLLFEELARWKADYRLGSIVAAPPYGLTFVYGREDDSARSSEPNVAVYLPQEKRWLKHLGAPLKSKVAPYAPLQTELQAANDKADLHAAASWSVQLKPGAYLISFDVPALSADQLAADPCFVTAMRSSTAKASWGGVGFGIPFSFCMPGQKKVYIVVDHPGGELYLGAFGHENEIHPAAIRPITGGAGQEFRSLPTFEHWKLVAQGGQRESTESPYRFTGDSSQAGYQLVSPPVSIPKHTAGRVALDLNVQQGNVVVGILGYGGQKWISSNGTGSSVDFDSQDSDDLQVVISNSNADSQAKKSVFTVQGDAKLFISGREGGEYVYNLAACSWPGRKPPAYCVGAKGGDADLQNRSGSAAATPGQTAPLGTITPLGDRAWERLIAPGRQDGAKIRIDGEPISAGAYAAKSVWYRLPKGVLIGAAGTVRQGGLVIGLLDAQERWAVQKAIGPGPFRVGIDAPAEGLYRIVVANNLAGGEKTNHAEVTEIGLVGLDPAKLALASKQSPLSAKP